jgi:hypothetical protein
MFGKMSTKQDIDFKLLERAMGVKQSGRGGDKNKRKWNINGQNQHEQMKASNGSIELEVLDCTVLYIWIIQNSKCEQYTLQARSIPIF